MVAARRAAGGLGAVAGGCAGESDLAEGEAGRIARVLDADSLALDTGLRVRLAEVEAPAAGYGDRVGEPGGGCGDGRCWSARRSGGRRGSGMAGCRATGMSGRSRM